MEFGICFLGFDKIMTHEDLLNKLKAASPEINARLIRESIFLENTGDLTKVATFLRDNPELKLNYLSSVTGADYLTFLESVYHFYSTEKRTGPYTLRVRTSREEPKVPSLTPIYRGAEYQEREAYDMYGIEYVGHPDLRRIFMWDEFAGWPMRKDYIGEDCEALDEEDLKWCAEHGVKVPENTPIAKNEPESDEQSEAPNEK